MKYLIIIIVTILILFGAWWITEKNNEDSPTEIETTSESNFEEKDSSPLPVVTVSPTDNIIIE